MPWYAYLLAPAAFLFHGITAARNFLFDRGLIRSQKSPIPTLVVGNLSVGGTGKTPWVEFLVRKRIHINEWVWQSVILFWI